MNKEIEINGHSVKLTNLEKVYWPKEGYTKEDLINYYLEIADDILPYLKERPESLHRYPNGIDGESFYQKDMNDLVPAWAKSVEVYSESHDKKINYLVCNNQETLLYMANLGCIEFNPWNSSLANLSKPDYIVLDLDPEDIPFQAVAETALTAHGVLDKLGIIHRAKTSGATGLHIYIPLARRYDYETAKNFARLLATLIHKKIPKITSLERSPAKRQKKVYLDYLQNSLGQTLASCFSVRPEKGATVSMPVNFKDLEKGVTPGDFTIANSAKIIKKKENDFLIVLSAETDIEKVSQSINS